MDGPNSYEEGRRDGRIEALEHMQLSQGLRLDHHERRLQVMERITYGLIGAIALAEFLPAIRAILV